MSAGRNFSAGLLAGVTEAVLIVTPLETLKVKLMELNKGFIRGTIHVLKTEGLGGAYKGLPATMGKCASNQSVRFLAYTEYTKFIQRRSGGEEGRGGRALTPIEALVGGMSAGALRYVSRSARSLVSSPVHRALTRRPACPAFWPTTRSIRSRRASRASAATPSIRARSIACAR